MGNKNAQQGINRIRFLLYPSVLRVEANPGFRFVPTFTRSSPNYRGWKEETGYVTTEMLSTYVGSLRGPIYYLAGPPAMVAAACRTLGDAGVDQDDVRTEEFVGYRESQEYRVQSAMRR